jgi:polyhydroxyalkanoate synthesis repressor PhaR
MHSALVNEIFAMQHLLVIMSAPVLIKKYGNRRLYDTGDSRYITLEELATKVRSGTDVRVLDAQNNDDLTQATLAQIILESGSAARVLPVGLLTQLVRLGDDALGEFFSRYVTHALDLYLQARRGVQNIASYNPFLQMQLDTAETLARMMPFGGRGKRAATPSPPMPMDAEPPPPPPERDEMAELRREIDELKRAMRPDGGGAPVAAPSVGKPGARRRARRGTP